MTPLPDRDLCEIRRPAQWRGGLIVASPHSGRAYPDWFVRESQLSLHDLRSSEDAFVDELAAQALTAGAVTLAAGFPRALVDVNRAEDDMDPQVVAPARGGGRRMASARAVSGLGVIPRVVGQGRVIRAAPLPESEARGRIERYWRPYHAALGALMDEAVARFGRAVLIDLHSMPRDALVHLPRPWPEVVLGDLNGRAAAPALVGLVGGAVAEAGLRLRMNSPFAGAHILTAFGRPAAGRHAMQLEIDRSLYMDERRIVPHDGFDRLAARLGAVFSAVARGLDDALPLAAE